MIPKVEFVYSEGYDEVLSKMMGKRCTSIQKRTVEEYLEKLEKKWKVNETKVLTEMSRITGIKWKYKSITCFLVNHCAASFSYPLTIRIRTKNGKLQGIADLMDTVIHELTHILLWSVKPSKNKKLGMKKTFMQESQLVRNHIYLDAVLKHIYLKFFGGRLERIKRDGGKEYLYAWRIVDKYSHEKLLKDLRNTTKSESA